MTTWRVPERHRSTAVLGLVGLLALTTHAIVPDGMPRAWLFVVIYAIGAGAIEHGVRRHRPSRRLPWRLLAGGIAAFGLSFLTWGAHGFVRPPSGTTAGLLYGATAGAGAVLLAACALTFLSARRPWRRTEGLIDAGIVVVAGILAVLMVSLALGTGSAGVVAVVLAPLFAAALAVGARLLRRLRRAGARVLVLTHLAGLVLVIVADQTWMHHPAGTSLRWVDLLYFAAVLGAAWTAQQPRMAALSHVDAPPATPLAPARPLVFGGALLLPPVLVTLSWLDPRSSLALPMGLGAAALTGLVLWRVGRLVREREHMHATIARTEQQLRALLEHSADVTAIIDGHGDFAYVSPAIERMLGHEPEAWVGRRASQMVLEADRHLARAHLRDVLAAPGRTGRFEVRIPDGRGAVQWVEATMTNRADDPHVAGVIVTLRETTERKHTELELGHLARHDPLTGLPNRTLLTERLQAASGHGRQGQGQAYALLLCDLDGFKALNDAHGHTVGDAVLVAVARRLESALRPGDTLARLGGDEFVALVAGVADQAALAAVAARLEASLAEPITVDGRALDVGVSVGGACADTDGPDTEALLHHADAAMYEVKHRRGAGREAAPAR